LQFQGDGQRLEPIRQHFSLPLSLRQFRCAGGRSRCRQQGARFYHWKKRKRLPPLRKQLQT
jgi:hypothetical protein